MTAETSSTSSEQSSARFRVLVVEDEMLLAMQMEDTLADFGCDVVGPVAHVAEGVKLAGSESLDGAILDINVAGAEVFPVARKLAERSIPFIFVSGYGSGKLPPEWRSRPTLQKPFYPQDLARRMAEAFNRQARMRMSKNEFEAPPR
jgi:DNA-binding response OmpR family regulator